MAFIQTFHCAACGYAAQVSGGADMLFAGYTRTMACEACHTLHDVLVSDHFSPKREVRCPACRSRRLRAWDHPAPCPKCGGAMAVDPDGPAMLAD